jgi:hypothetical protein
MTTDFADIKLLFLMLLRLETRWSASAFSVRDCSLQIIYYRWILSANLWLVDGRKWENRTSFNIKFASDHTTKCLCSWVSLSLITNKETRSERVWSANRMTGVRFLWGTWLLSSLSCGEWLWVDSDVSLKLVGHCLLGTKAVRTWSWRLISDLCQD